MPMTATPLVEAERNDLGDFFETLTPQQWAAPSLCEHWTVRDVVAHVVSYEGAGAAELARRFAQGRFALNHINDVSLDQQREREPDELLALLRKHLSSRPHVCVRRRIALVDTSCTTRTSGEPSACRVPFQPTDSGSAAVRLHRPTHQGDVACQRR